jgi:hypothetical protein
MRPLALHKDWARLVLDGRFTATVALEATTSSDGDYTDTTQRSVFLFEQSARWREPHAVWPQGC